MLSKDTTLCISIASRPSNFGASLFNLLFGELGMDWAYKPFKVGPESLAPAVAAIRALPIRGCGVSMPHKAAVMKYLDRVDPTAARIGAVNTIVNEGGKLTGYNTDYAGFARAIGENYRLDGKAALVFGAGGAARAAITAAKGLGAKKIFVCSRNPAKARALCRKFGCTAIPRSLVAKAGARLFFNATPVGMFPYASRMPITRDELASFEAVADAVNNPHETALIRAARRMGKVAIAGCEMSFYQGLAQFALYTGKNAPKKIERKALRALLPKR